MISRQFKLGLTFFSLVLLEACVYDEFPPDLKSPSPVPDNLCSGFEDGYTDKISYLPGERMKIYLHAKEAIDLCRLNVYTIEGKYAFAVGSSLTYQPIYTENPSSDGFNYSATSLAIVPDIKSGVYLIENTIPFIIKSAKAVDVIVVYPSNTANAYCESGGKSFYSRLNRPAQVSFQRPIPLQSLSVVCLKWFSTLEDISVGYIADIDLDNYSNLAAGKILTIAGHSEYWTREARMNFDKFVDQGGHALILSGNTMWWQVRYSDDRSKLICYKDVDADPVGNPLLKTINWKTPSLQYPIIPSIGADFDHGGYGMQTDNGWDGYKVASPASPLLEGLNLNKGDLIKMPTREYDGVPLSGYDPDGFPIVNFDSLSAYKIELIGFDKGFRMHETAGTFIVMKRTSSSGIIINTASTDWCSRNGMGGESGDLIKKITFKAITKLLHDQPVFSN